MGCGGLRRREKKSFRHRLAVKIEKPILDFVGMKKELSK
jgi:hypothetical protein